MFIKYASRIKLIQVNFSNSWWQLFMQQKWRFLFIIFSVTSIQIFWSLIPFFIALIFGAKSFWWCLILFAGWLVLELNMRFATRISQNFQLSCIHSIYQYAHQYLLTIDPQYHIHRSSGALLAKIERGARGYEDFADHVTYEFTPLITGLITVIVTLAFYSIFISLSMLLFVTGIFTLGYFFTKFVSAQYENDFIKSDDYYKTIAAENLAQIHLIRSTFGTDFRIEKLTGSIQDNVETEAQLWYVYPRLFFILNLCYIISLFALSLMLLWQINMGTTSIAAAIGLFLSYIQSSKDIPRILRLFRKTTQSLMRIKDLFNFLSTFGKQNFPVLGKEQLLPSVSNISIAAQHLYFRYGNEDLLFNDHSLLLNCSFEQKNKLYGLIGPSGSGKTTLLSILGGQLKPQHGDVFINHTNIYNTNDATRRKLITLQGQIATTLSGSVKSNLLLGLPEQAYSDNKLQTVLERIGLWAIFNEQQGLFTLLGEGGLNLSGGQRQRLNFAGLYLRASYYKPSLILIDEPTSSLDELSETTITIMIQELATIAVTIVIAHRLKTIEQAIALIDLSLLKTAKEILPYSSDILLTKSLYYQQLIQGKITLDE